MRVDDKNSETIRPVGMITRIIPDETSDRELAVIWVPTSPNPTSGYIKIVPLSFVMTTGTNSQDSIRFTAGDGRVITLQTSGSNGVPKRLSFTPADLAGNDDRVLVLLPFTQPDTLGTDRLVLDFVALAEKSPGEEEIRRQLLRASAIRDSLVEKQLVIGRIRQVAGLPASQTVKRTIVDQRHEGEGHAAHP